MPASSAREATTAFLTRARLSLQCVAKAEVFHSPSQSDNYTLFAVAHDSAYQNSNLLPLHNTQRMSHLLLRVDIGFRVERLSDRENRGRAQARITDYRLQIFTGGQRELVAFHWHPSSFSRFRTPHLHVSGVSPIALNAATSLGSVGSLDIGKAHFPTRHILLEDVVEMLIADPVFAVAPRRADWRQVLATNRVTAHTPDAI